MDLVRSEYAEEAAVLFAWLSALLPWSFTYGSPGGSRFVVIRFPFVLYENLSGFSEQFDGTRIITPLDALERAVELGLQQEYASAELESRYGSTDTGLTVETLTDALATGNAGQVWAYVAWTVGIAVLLAAVVLSLLMYVEADALDALPVDVVRLMAALLLAAAVLYAAATVLLWRNYPGVFLPLGPVLYFVFGGTLLTIDR